MIKVLVVGQTPPPFGGQAVMIKKMLEGNYKQIKLYHIRMAFSKDMDDIGRFRLSKILHLFIVVAKIYYLKFRYNIKVLYYPPAGPDRIPVYRDIIILIATRWMFKRVIFHFHAGGVSLLYSQLPWFAQKLFRMCYFNVDAAIRLSEYSPDDGKGINALSEFIIPNGVDDDYAQLHKSFVTTDKICTILFVGVVMESKGVAILISAANTLKERGLRFKLIIVGRFISPEFEEYILAEIHNKGLGEYIEITGVLTGDSKFEKYLEADIFCFPTFFASESFPVVLIEAMQFSLPIVATRWRGIQSLVEDDVNGFLVPIKDSLAIAEKLEILIRDPNLRNKMGMNGRDLYLTNYTVDKFTRKIEECILSVAKL